MRVSSIVALSLFLLASSSLPAGAVYQCGPDKDSCQCGKDDPYPCCSNGGNCTWWAWEQACCHWGVGIPGWGNANQWAGNAKASPNYDVLAKPVVGAIANRVSGSFGHVAWVTSVSGSTITVTEQNCWGGWGHDTATYNASFFDGGFIVRHSQCDCSPGESQTQTCGNCGEQKRSCNSSCGWGAWSACSGEGECTPGDTDEKSCGMCGKKARSCQDDCSWGSYDTCSTADCWYPSSVDAGAKPPATTGGQAQPPRGTTEKATDGEASDVSGGCAVASDTTAGDSDFMLLCSGAIALFVTRRAAARRNARRR